MTQETEEDVSTYIGTRHVDGKGRVTIPSDVREEHDIRYHDKVRLTVETIPHQPDEMRHVFQTRAMSVQSRGQVTIPATEREMYAIGAGDKVNILVEIV